MARKGALTTDKLILYIVAALVLVSVLIFLFKADLNRWVNNLPGYQPPEDREIILAQQQPDAEGISRICPVKVGNIAPRIGDASTGTDAAKGTYIHVKSIVIDPKLSEGYSLGGSHETFLEWNAPNIELDETFDEVIGSVSGVNLQQILFKNSILTNPDAYRSSGFFKHPKLPSNTDLLVLEGAYKAINTNDLCKSVNQMKELVRWLSP